MKLQDFKRSDFEFSFEAKGATFLFEDIVVKYYDPLGDTITTLVKGGDTRMLSSKKLIKEMHEEGEKRTPEQTRKIIKELETLVRPIKSQILELNRKSELSFGEAKQILKVLADLCTLYLYFDFNYWETVFEKSDINLAMKENVRLVQEFKNKIRAELDLVYFDVAQEKGFLPTFVRVLCKQFKISENILSNYTDGEILELFEGKEVERKIIEAREKATVFYKNSFGEIECSIGDEALSFIASFDTASEVQTQFKGKVAHAPEKKIIRGSVVVISQDYNFGSVMREKIEKMKVGQILVSETTSPDFIEAMKKALAIITDVGGMLSHAAITSRELNIPCIVGTGSASKVLKDGDMVEIDPNNGTIRLLK